MFVKSCFDKNNDICDVKCITTYTNLVYHKISEGRDSLQKLLKVLIFIGVPHRGISITEKLTWNSKYGKQFKRIPMMTRKNNVDMTESNDVDHKNVVVIWISFADEEKYFS